MTKKSYSKKEKEKLLHFFSETDISFSVIMNAPNPFFFIDLNNEFKFVNYSFIDGFEISIENISGHSPFDVFDLHEAAAINDGYNNVIKNLKVHTFEFEINSNKEYIIYNVTMGPVFNQNNELVGTYGSMDKTTLDDNNENALNRLEIVQQENNNLKSLNKSKDLTLSMIAHDLKSPLGSQLNLIKQMVRHFDKYSDDRVKELLNIVYQSSGQVYNLFNDLLLWARHIINGNEVPKECLNLNDIIQCNLEFFKSNAWSKEISIHNKLKENYFIYGNCEMVSGIIRNLLSNALKFTQNNGNITINAVKNNKTVEFCIADDGIGMSEKKLQNIFSKTISSKGTNEESGSGLGLMMCKEFIYANDGEICIESKEEDGTKFTIALPAAKN